MKCALVTGSAIFIGAHLCLSLLEATHFSIVGLDNMNGYYDVDIKEDRLRMLRESDAEYRFEFVRGDVADADVVELLFAEHRFDAVVHIAA